MRTLRCFLAMLATVVVTTTAAAEAMTIQQYTGNPPAERGTEWALLVVNTVLECEPQAGVEDVEVWVRDESDTWLGPYYSNYQGQVKLLISGDDIDTIFDIAAYTCSTFEDPCVKSDFALTLYDEKDTKCVICDCPLELQELNQNGPEF